VIEELRVRARFLSYVGLAGTVVFSLLILRLYPGWREDRLRFLLIVLMELASFGFFLYTRRILAGLSAGPSDAQLVRWAEFLTLYIYPKFLFRKRKRK